MVKVVLKAVWQFCGYREEPVKGTQIIFFEHGWHESNEFFINSVNIEKNKNLENPFWRL